MPFILKLNLIFVMQFQLIEHSSYYTDKNKHGAILPENYVSM